MPSADFHIRGDTSLDAGGFESGVSKLGSLAAKGFSVIGAAIGTATAALGTAAVASVKLASDLTEVQNVVDTTFGDNAGAVNEWAANAAEAFGMSELQAKQFNGTMGAMLKSMGLADDEVLNMSTSMVGLAGDFASFYNLDHQEAFDKIRAGISGETEPLKQLGINMSVANLEAYALSQGITKSYNSMTQAEQATLRYNYLMSTTADAQGDFAKTSGSLANQLRIAQLQVQNLGAAIGEALLPMATQMVGVGVDMLGKLTEGFQQGGVEGLLAAAQDVITQLTTSLAQAAPQLIETAVSLLSAIAQGITGALPALAGAALQIVGYLAQTILEHVPQLLESGLAMLQTLLQGILDALPEIAGTALQVISQFVGDLAARLPDILNQGGEILRSLLEGVGSALPEIAGTVAQVIGEFIQYVVTNLPDIIGAGFDLLVSFIEGIFEALPELGTAAENIVSTIWDKVTSIDWLQLGKDIINGILNGVMAVGDALIDGIVNLCSGALQRVKDFFGISSPSRVMRDEVGKMLPEGMALGIEADTSKVRQAMQAMARSGYDAVQASQFGAPRMALQPALAGGVTNSTSIVQYITQYNAVTIDAKNVKDFNDVVAVFQNHEKVVRQGYTRR